MKKLVFVIVSLLFALVACDDRPDNILSRSKMEDVLFDYHITQGLIEQLPLDQRESKAREYINAVFEKHGICEADFDSSAVYYNRHAKDLYKIYSNLNDRYAKMNEELQLQNGNNDMTTVFIGGGDTTNIWNAPRLVMLRNKELLNHESFTIHADSTFHQHDQIIMRFTPVFINDNQGSNRDVQLNVGLSIVYKDGKSVSTTKLYNYGDWQQIMLKAEEDKDIMSITGFFFYKGKKDVRNVCFVSGIELIRMHELEKQPEEEKTDSVATDSVNTDTIVPETPAHRYTPEELRKVNSSGKSIKIETAPSVRTPNTIGPRRRRQSMAPRKTN